MENAADALIMAGAVFVLVIILTVTAFAFSNARQSLDNITALTDKESLTVQGNQDYYYLSTENNSNTSRNVGMETIIPAIHRAFYENYKIQFDFSNVDPDYYLYKDKDGKPVNTIDLDSDLSALNNKQREDFINAILYHTYNGSNSLVAFNENLKKSLGDKIKIDTDKGLIEFAENRTFDEKLGIYYIEDVNSKEENIKEYGSTYRKYYF